MASAISLLDMIRQDVTLLDTINDRVFEEWALDWSPRLTKYIPHTPFAKQIAFLCLDNKEALYGGAAGGGKSDALLMAALQYVDVPGYAAILFRRTYADLERPGALIPRSHEWLRPTDAHWNGRRWTFPSGAVLDFGYLDNSSDVYHYQSAEYQFVGFDELTQFQEQWYRYLFTRRRRTVNLVVPETGQPIPTRFRSGTNPGGAGHDWVKQRFLVEGLERGRAFVPSLLEDNPYLDQEDYDESLKELDEVTYQQYRFGDWNIHAAGIFFNRAWFKFIDPEEIPNSAQPIRMWDLAATKNQTSAYTAGALTSFHDGRMIIHEVRRMRGDPGEVEAFIRATAEQDGRGVPIWMEQEPGSGGVNTVYRYRHFVLAGFTFEEYLPKHDKLTRASPLSALARHGGVWLVKGGRWLGPYLDELEAFPNGFKDQVDVSSASLQVHSQRKVWNIRQL